MKTPTGWQQAVVCLALGGIVITGLTAAPERQAFAETASPGAAATEPVYKDTKTVTGTVTGVTKHGLGVEYEQTGQTSKEVLIPYDAESVKLSRIKKISELVFGDTVEVLFEQSYRKNPDGTRFVLGTQAKQITLVKRKMTGSLTSSGESVR